GVTVTTISPGDGVNFPHTGDSVTIHFSGASDHGLDFGSTRDRGAPLITQIGAGRPGVIEGWDEGIMQMSLGQRAILTITPDVGVESARELSGGIIVISATFKFDVELLKIN
ncbi:peptidyl-prolyl cis-trans isomerase, partial [Imleria badia]